MKSNLVGQGREGSNDSPPAIHPDYLEEEGLPRRADAAFPAAEAYDPNKHGAPHLVFQSEAYNTEGQGIKHDQGKLMWHLFPLWCFHGVVRVLMAGAKKYAPWNWTKGMPYSQTYNAAIRHLDAFMGGEDFDPETGESHLDHAQCCIMFLKHHFENHKNLDDRFKGNVK